MICKKDVIQWFKDLESYKRIDTMCSLLLVCLPFELRFLGTFLEELGRRDSQRLRGMELRVNNPQDLEADMGACQIGEPTDIKIRRRMALYLALLRVCNRKCVAEIFKTLENWGERDFLNMTDSDTLHELLLVYTMAANHPVFSFDQHMKCTAVLERIKENKLIKRQEHLRSGRDVSGQQPINFESTMESSCQVIQPASQQDFLPTHTFQTLHSTGQQHSQLVHILPQGSVPVTFPHHLQKIISNDGTIQHQMSVDGIQHILSPNISIPTDSNTLITHPNPGWSVRAYQSGGMEHTPKSSSPMLSQQSSPSSSRTASPNRSVSSCLIQQQSQQSFQSSQPQNRNLFQRISSTMKSARRLSADTTPPPMGPQHQPIMQNELSSQNIKHMEDVLVHTETGNSQLQNFIRNGYSRMGQHQRMKSSAYMPPQLQQQQSSVNQNFQPITTANYTSNSGISYAMQNMAISDISNASHSNLDIGLLPINSNKSTGSDSGSSMGSSGEISPPETPTLIGNTPLRLSNDQIPNHHFAKQVGASSRLNGRAETQSNNTNNHNSSSGGSVYVPVQPPQSQSFNNDIILAPGGNAGSNLLQSVITNNSNSSNVGLNVNTVNAATTTNNNISNIASLISSPNVVSPTSNLLGANVITTNAGPVLLQSHQPPYQTNFNFQSACQHVATPMGAANRAPPPILTGNPTMAPSGSPASFRLQNAFQISHSVVEPLIYPAYPAGIFLPGAPAPQNTQLAIRNNTSNNSVGSSSIPAPLQLPIQQAPPLAPQNHPNAPLPPTSILSSAYKTFSCYNCGSPSHHGRECSEVSMEDATRNAVYKLDFSVSAASSISSSTATSNSTNIQSPSDKLTHHIKDIQTQNSSAPTTSTVGLQTIATAPPSSTPKVGLQK